MIAFSPSIRGSRQALAVLGTIGLVTAVQLTAGAQEDVLPAGVRLTWISPPQCPGQEAVRADLARLLRPSARAARAVVSARASVRRAGPHLYRLELRMEGEGGASTRALEAPRCATLASAAALLVAMRADPDVDPLAVSVPSSSAAFSSPVAPSSSAASSLPAPSAAAPAAPSAAAPAAPSAAAPSAAALAAAAPAASASAAGSASSGPAGASPVASGGEGSGPAPWVGVAGVIEAGALPGGGPGMSIAGGLRSEGYRAGLRGTVLASRRAESAVAGVGGNLRFFSIGPIGCFAGGERPRVEGCGGLEAGKISGEGVGVPIVEAGGAWWAAASLSGALLWPLFGGLSGRVEAEAALSVMRARYVIGGVGEIHRPAALSGRGSVGLEWRFF